MSSKGVIKMNQEEQDIIIKSFLLDLEIELEQFKCWVECQ